MTHLPASQNERDVKDLAGGSLVNLVGKAGRLSKTTFIAVVKLLFGAEVLGLYEVAWGIVSTVGKIGLYGLHRGVLKYVVEARTSGDQSGAARVIGAAMGLGLTVSFVFAAATLPASRWIAHTLYDDPALAPAIDIMVWTVPLVTLSGIFIAATRALRIMRYDVYVASIGAPLILLAAGGLAGFLGYGLLGLAVAQVVMAIGMCLLSLYYFGRHFSLRACLPHLGDTGRWRTLHSFSFPVMLLEVIGNILLRLDILMLAAYGSPQAAGIYAIAKRIASATLKLPQSFDPIFSSIASDLSFRREYAVLSAHLASVARWSLTMNLVLLGVMLLAGDTILSLLGKDTVMATGALGVLCFGMLAYSIFSATEQLLIMSGRQYLSLVDTLVWLIANVLLNLWLIPTHGIMGAAVATGLAMNLANVLRLVQVYVIYGCHPFDLSQLKPIAAALVAYAAGYGLEAWLPLASLGSKAIACGAFLLVYIGALWQLGLDPQDRMLLGRAVHRLRPSSKGRHG